MRINIKTTVVIVGCAALFPMASAAGETKTGSARSVKAAIDSATQNADRFEEHLARALDQSPVDGSDLEDRLNSWADFIGDQLDEVADNYADDDFDNSVDHFENAIIAATGINRFMLRNDFLEKAGSDWRALREDLNRIAKEWRRPVLPNLTVAAISQSPAQILERADVNQVLGEIEDSLDRFSDKFEKAIRYYSTSSGTRRADFFTRWADDLERASDQMLEERKEKDAKEFQQQLDNTLVVASAVNRIMVRSELDKAAHLEWNNVRDGLNTVARAFGRPVLPELAVYVRQSVLR